MKKILLAVFLCVPFAAFAQSGGMVNGTRGYPQPNDGTTGTVVNETAIVNSAANAITAATSNTTVPTYIVVGGAGTTGNAVLASNGTLAPCKMDTAVSSSGGGYYIINSTTTAGDCHPQSAAPSAGIWVIGTLHDATTSSGSNALVSVNGYFYSSSSAGANTALSNLAAVSINTSLLAQTGVDLGSTAAPFRNLYLFGSGTFGTDYFEFTGTPSSTRTVTIPDASFTMAQTVATGTAAMGTSAISSGTCATVVTVTATGVATTDTIQYTPNADPTAVTGYAPSASGSLYIWAYPTSGDVNFRVCNNTSGSITPSALTLNWRVAR